MTHLLSPAFNHSPSYRLGNLKTAARQCEQAGLPLPVTREDLVLYLDRFDEYLLPRLTKFQVIKVAGNPKYGAAQFFVRCEDLVISDLDKVFPGWTEVYAAECAGWIQFWAA